MKRMLSTLALLSLGALCLSLPQRAVSQVSPAPSLLNFQGRLAKPDGTPVADGIYTLRFSLWDALSGGNEKWNQTLNSVMVKNGTFAALLNVNTANLFNGDLYVEIKVGTNAPLTPRQRLVSVAYAMKANTVPDGSITASKLANDALTGLSWLLGGNSITNPATQFLGTTSNQPLAFRTNNTEKMRLLSNGKLGIGTNNPGMSLEVTAPSYYGLPSLGGSTGSNYAYLHISSGDHSLIWNNTSALRFGTESTRETGYTELVRITPSGQLAIGTSTATSPLTFRNYDERKITYWETADGINHFYGVDLSLGQVRHWVGVYGAFVVGNFNTADSSFTERFRVNGDGNVGIGTSGPITRLDVNGGVAIRGNSTLEFGATVGGKEPNAGKIGYQTFTPGALDIIGAGTSWPTRKIKFWNEGGATFAGEITAPVVTVTGGSDVAEPYHVAPAGNILPKPGMVVTIDPNKIGQMRVSRKAYDKTVAGILSGANGIQPGITLRQKGTLADGTLPVASLGRVWCWCDASANGAIQAGDMLTTSNTPGHAMKVTRFQRANGAVIGKAMSGLQSGRGLVLVLVSLK